MLIKSNKYRLRILSCVLLILPLVSCDSSTGDTTTPTSPDISKPINATATINWIANREKAMNAINSGYKVFYSKSTPVTLNNSFVDVPYDAALQNTPTTTKINITTTGKYYFAVQAYSALKLPNGTKSSLSKEFSLVIQ